MLLPVLIILLLSSNDTHAQFTLNSGSVFKNGSPNSGRIWRYAFGDYPYKSHSTICCSGGKNIAEHLFLLFIFIKTWQRFRAEGILMPHLHKFLALAKTIFPNFDEFVWSWRYYLYLFYSPFLIVREDEKLLCLSEILFLLAKDFFP